MNTCSILICALNILLMRVVLLFPVVLGQFDWLARIASDTNKLHVPVVPVPTPGTIPPSAEEEMSPEELLASLRKLHAEWTKLQTRAESQGLFKEKTDEPGNFGGAPPVGTQQSAQQLDLLCSPAWRESKRRLAEVFSQPAAALVTLSPMEISSLISTVSESLPVSELADGAQCGLARLSLQMLSTIEQISRSSADEVALALLSTEPLHSPMLTVLLDVPWVETVNSGWPFFPLLAQWHLRNLQAASKVGGERDGMNEQVIAEFHKIVTEALRDQNLGRVVEISSEFLKIAGNQQVAESYPIAVAAALAGVTIGVKDPIEKASLFENTQSIIVASIRNPNDLVYVLHSVWPIWSLLNLATMAFQ